MNVQPILATSYTERGNEYKKSNAGKYGAAATVGGGATIIAMKGIKEIPFDKMKNIDFEKLKKVELPKIKNIKIKKPNFKNMLQNMFAGIEKMAVKAQIKLAKPAKKTAEKVAKSAVLANAWQNVKNFVSNSGRKIADVAVETGKTLKTPKALKAAKYAGFVAGAIVAGLAIDYAFNKISEYKADRK